MMKHQIFEVSTFTGGKSLHQKFIQYSQCFIMTPLNQKKDYLKEEINYLFKVLKTNISFKQNVGFLFLVRTEKSFTKIW